MGGQSGWLRSDAAATMPFLSAFTSRLGGCHACDLSPVDASAVSRLRACWLPSAPAWPRVSRNRPGAEEPPRRDAPRRPRRPHAGGHRPHPQRPARRLFRAAVARPDRRAGAARRRAAWQSKAGGGGLRRQADAAACASLQICSWPIGSSLYSPPGLRPAPIRRPTGRGATCSEFAARPVLPSAVIRKAMSPLAIRTLRPPPPGGRIRFRRNVFGECPVSRRGRGPAG